MDFMDNSLVSETTNLHLSGQILQTSVGFVIYVLKTKVKLSLNHDVAYTF